MAAGDIARRLKLPQNTLSFHLAALARAHLVASRKEGRSIIYCVDLDGTRELSLPRRGLLCGEGGALRAFDRSPPRPDVALHEIE